MFTTETGERRIRVINHKFDVSSRLEAVWDSVDYLAFANMTARNYVSKIVKADPVKVREDAINWLGVLIGEFMGRASMALSAKYHDMTLPLNFCWALSYLHVIFNSRLFLSTHKMSADARI